MFAFDYLLELHLFFSCMIWSVHWN